MRINEPGRTDFEGVGRNLELLYYPMEEDSRGTTYKYELFISGTQ